MHSWLSDHYDELSNKYAFVNWTNHKFAVTIIVLGHNIYGIYEETYLKGKKLQVISHQEILKI